MHDAQVSVAVTGAAGYIGSPVVALFQQEHPDWAITALDDFSHGEIRTIGDVSVQDVDIRDRDRLEAAVDDVDVIAHLAALSYEMEQHLIAHGCPADRISVVPLPVDTSKVEYDPTPRPRRFRSPP